MRALVLLLALASTAIAQQATRSEYHGLKAITLKNALAQVVIVPATGRILSFQLCDSHGRCSDNPIWNNPQIGASLKPDDEGWTNYGGDKSWPAPQSDWPKHTGKGWPPPTGFDHMPFTAEITEAKVTLASPVDPGYGVRVRRVISLDSTRPVLHVATTYEKLQGDPVDVSVWTITQLNAPERGFILLPADEKFPGGHIDTSRTGPNDPYPFEKVSIDGRLLSFIRDPKVKRKLGSDGDRLLWLGKSESLLIEQKTSSTRIAKYPDGGSHSQIYTNPDELPYVEFELMGPLKTMKVGDFATLNATYTLQHRKSKDEQSEAKHLFNLE
jgi:Domain of unknown function (DUF4380)